MSPPKHRFATACLRKGDARNYENQNCIKGWTLVYNNNKTKTGNSMQRKSIGSKKKCLSEWGTARSVNFDHIYGHQIWKKKVRKFIKLAEVAHM